jgi:uracil phosphoribosyltransferase
MEDIRIMGELHVLDHPLLQHKLSIIRDKNTSVKEFREIVSEIATLMCYDATRDLPIEEVQVETPVATATVKRIAGKKMAVVPILRAGLGMVDGIISLVPSVKVGHIGLYRDPDTLEPVKYYCKMPKDIAERDVIIVDPMLATGGSATAAIAFLKEYGCRHIKLMNIIAAPVGIARVRADHPDVDIYVASVDERLNEHGYIVPGLGDAGDRIFGTK